MTPVEIIGAIFVAMIMGSSAVGISDTTADMEFCFICASATVEEVEIKDQDSEPVQDDKTTVLNN